MNIFKRKREMAKEDERREVETMAMVIAKALVWGGNSNPSHKDQIELLIDMDDWGLGFPGITV